MDDQRISDITAVDALAAVVKSLMLALPQGTLDEADFALTLDTIRQRMVTGGVTHDAVRVIDEFLSLARPTDSPSQGPKQPPWLRGVFDGQKPPEA